MNAAQVIEYAAGKFDTPAQAILTYSEQTGVQLRLEEGERLKAKGDREVIAAWQPMIQRHKVEIVAALAGRESDADFVDALVADSEELAACIIELCQLAGYADDARARMLAARDKIYPFHLAIECAYFRLQVIRARAGEYWPDETQWAA
jgi:hypothetical protein